MQKLQKMKDIDTVYQYAVGDGADAICASQFILSLWDSNKYSMDTNMLIWCSEDLFTALRTALSHLFINKHSINMYISNDKIAKLLGKYANKTATRLVIDNGGR